MKYISLSAIVLATALTAAAQTTTRQRLRTAQAAAAAAPLTAVDTLARPEPHIVDVNGYDKPLRSNYETFFVTNRHSRTIVRITIDIDYIDMNGSQLHSRSVTVECEIPPGATRQLHTRAWDRQKAFYHHTTRSKPRSPHARPYKVVVTPVSLLLE